MRVSEGVLWLPSSNSFQISYCDRISPQIYIRQSPIKDPSMALHSSFNSVNSKTVCGLPILPVRCKSQGIIPLTKDTDIIDEAISLFRINVLFKNFSINGNADKMLVYIFVCLNQCFKVTENEKLQAGAKKRLSQILATPIPKPKDKGFFMNTILDEPRPGELQVYGSFLKQMKDEIVMRFLERFYAEGMQIEDFRFWSGLARKKFMGYSFTTGF